MKGKTLVQRAREQGKIPSRPESAIEAQLALQMQAEHFPAWKRNHVFLLGRKFEIDFCWADLRAGIEVEGEVHRISERFHKDIEKHALAKLAGWTILRVDGRSIRDGRAVAWARHFLIGEGAAAW